MDCLDSQQQSPFEDNYPPLPHETEPFPIGDRTVNGGLHVASDQYSPSYPIQTWSQGESATIPESTSMNTLPFPTWQPSTATMPQSMPPRTMPMTTTASISNITAPSVSTTTISRVKPPYVDLNATRVSPAGPVPHPDPNFHPVGPNNWTEILHNYKLLQYLSNSNIKEIRQHVAQLAESPDPTGGGRWAAEDLTAVWKYCDAYLKRRGQLRNNDAARRSRARKDAEIRHWRLVALAAGAEDKVFEYDSSDPAYDNDGLDQDGREIVTVARVTAEAISIARANQLRGVNVNNEQFGFSNVPGPRLPSSSHPHLAMNSSVPQPQQYNERRESPLAMQNYGQDRVKRRRTATPQEAALSPMSLVPGGFYLTDAGSTVPQMYNSSHPDQNVDGGGQDNTTQDVLVPDWNTQKFC